MKILYILLMLTSFSMFSQSPKINNHLYDGNEKVKNEICEEVIIFVLKKEKIVLLEYDEKTNFLKD